MQYIRASFQFIQHVAKALLAFINRMPRWGRIGAVIALLLVISFVGWQWRIQQQYVLSAAAQEIVGETNPKLAKKLKLDKQNNFVFNQKAQQPAKSLSEKVGSGGKTLYSLDITEKGKTTYHDTNLDLQFTLQPQFANQQGTLEDGRLVFPLIKGGQAVYTVKGNGLKEDIIFEKAPAGGETTFSYTLKLPETLEARKLENGAVGIFSANPILFGDMKFGSDSDKMKVLDARKTAPKDHLVFALPAPTIVAASGKTGGASARFTLEGDKLKVRASGLDAIEGTFSIDPSVVVTSSNDFLTGNSEDNIQFGTDQISRGSITGGTVGNWQATSSFSTARSNAGSAVYNGYLYILGGTDHTDVFSDVQYAKLNANGTLGTWQTTTGLSAGLKYPGVTAYNGYLYVIGGENASEAMVTDVQYAPINANGSVGSWQTSTNLPVGLGDHQVASYNGYLYVAGGWDGSGFRSDVWYAKTNADGTVGNWQTTSSFTTARGDHGMAVYNNHLYVIGGYATGGNMLSDVQYAAINADGTLGSWQTTSSFSNGRESLAVTAHKGYLYVLGGSNDTRTFGDVQYAPIYSDGTVGEWQTSTAFREGTNYNDGFTALEAAAYDGYLYIAGGYDWDTDVNTVQYARVAAAGQLRNWQYDTPAEAVPNRNNHATGIYNGYIYVGGGFDFAGGPNYRNDFWYAPLNANGSVGAWTQTAGLPTGVSNAASGVYNGYFYVIGGRTSATVSNKVYYAPINANGSLGAWQTNSINLPDANQRGRAVFYNGYAYLIGGYSEKDFNLTNEILYAPINADGSLGNWQVNATSFTTARDSHEVVEAGSYLYVIGGQTTGSTKLNDVQYAKINNDGTVGSWTAAGNFTTPRISFSHAVVNGYLYIFGGEDGSGAMLQDVQYAPINADGSLGTWQTNEPLQKMRKGMGAATNGTTIYVTGGTEQGSGEVNNIEYVFANNGGSGEVSSWNTTTNSFTTTRESHTSVVYDGYLYVIGGDDAGDVRLTNVQYAKIESDGDVGTWQTATNLPAARSHHTSVAYNGYLYVLGGNSGTNTAYYAPVNPDGSLGAWNTTTSLPSGMTNHASAVYDGTLYVVGGENASSIGQSTVLYANINANGTLGTWQTTASLPNGTYDHAVSVYNGYLYVTGGMVRAQNDDFQDGFEDGTLTPFTTGGDANWSVVTDPVNSGAYSAQSGDITDGDDSAACPDPGTTQTDLILTRTFSGSAEISFSYKTITEGDFDLFYFYIDDVEELQHSGLSDWLSSPDFPVTSGAHTFKWTYCKDYAYSEPDNGGYPGDTVWIDDVTINDTSSTPDAPTEKVYYAKINPGGTVGPWQVTSSLPETRIDHSSVAYNGYLYVTGGSAAGSNSNDVLKAPIMANGSLGEWRKTTDLPDTGANNAAAFHNGNLYAIGGEGTASTINETFYTALQSIPRIGHYSKLVDLGVSDGVLTNISYTGVLPDGLEAIQFRKAGSDSNFSELLPASQAAEEAPTDPCVAGGTQYVQLFARLDDTLTATFPDTESTHASIADLTVDYSMNNVHPPTELRLRGGQWFKNGNIQPLDTCGG